MNLVKALSAIAVGGCLPVLHALDVSDNDLKLGLSLNLQTRIEVADAKNTVGDDYNIEANGDGKADTADFYVRRFRPGFKGTYMGVWKFAAIWRLDDTDRAGVNRTTATIHQGWVGREFKEENYTQTVRMGLDYAFFNHAEASNSATLLPIQRASAALLPVRGAGIGYGLSTSMVRWGVDIQNNIADDAVAQPASATLTPDGEGLCFTTRVEITGAGDMAIPKWQETWAGKEGTGWILGLEAGMNQQDRFVIAGAGASADTVCYGGDFVFHWNALSALVEARALTRKFDLDSGANQPDLKQLVYDAQIGYAFTSGDVVWEPAIRYTLIDLNTDDDNEVVNYGQAAIAATASSALTNKDYGNSGTELDIGVNCYFNGHANKLSLCYSMWSAEDGDADANIIRLQHQLNF